MAVHPDDRAATTAAWRKADVSGVLDIEHRLINPAQPESARWFHTHAAPLPEAGGREREWLGTCTDVHETRLLEKRQRLLRDALQHRVSGILALIRSIARRMAGASASVKEYALHLDSRLDAVARTQAMMLRSPKAGVDLEILVADGLLAHAAREGEQVRVSGPAFALRGAAAELFGLVIHELAMNAVEHGALSASQGRITVAWRPERTETGDALRFEWVETGVPTPEASAPRCRGFGTGLIENILKLELGAVSSLSFHRDEMRCTIVLPLATSAAVPDLHPPG